MIKSCNFSPISLIVNDKKIKKVLIKAIFYFNNIIYNITKIDNFIMITVIGKSISFSILTAKKSDNYTWITYLGNCNCR